MYPWIRDAAAAAAAAAVGVNFPSPHHHNFHPHHQNNLNNSHLMSSHSNGVSNGKNENYNQQSHAHLGAINDCMLALDYAHTKKEKIVNSGEGTPQLMHWMSAVMAEHLNQQQGGDGIHYIWNGTSVEGKLSSPDSHHQNSVKSDEAISPSNNAPLYGSPPSSVSISSPSSLPAPQQGKGRKYSCKMCPQIFSSKADLQLHNQAHMREAKPYKCTQCTKAFANSSYLSQHSRIHMGVKPYRCEICQRKFTQLSHLQQHIRTHTGDKPYKCRHGGCNKAFSQLSNLQSHSRCHQTDKPYKCNSCYKCFVDEAALLDHIPKHKESKHLKTHICPYCGKSYTQETYLAKHMQKHTEKAEKKRLKAAAANSSNNTTNNANNSSNTNGGGNNNGGHYEQNGGINSTSNHHNGTPNGVVMNGGSGSGVLSGVSGEIYWKAEMGEGGLIHLSGSHPLPQQHRSGSEGPDDLRISTSTNSTSSSNHTSSNHTTSNSTNGGNPYDALVANALAVSTKGIGASAFTPIQTNGMIGMGGSVNGSGMNGGGGGRAYLSYESLPFGNNKQTGTPFPNQLISLHQIRNYAHQPMTPEHLLGLKDTK